MNIQSIVESPQDLHVARHFEGVAEDGPQLLELRTESGSVYVRLSQWQRIRLLWTFRHFHVLPPQVLSRQDRHLIEELSRSAPVPLPLPAASSIIGVVEKARTGSVSTARQRGRTPGAGPRALQLEPSIRDKRPFRKDSGLVAISQAAAVGAGSGVGGRFRQWGALGMLAAVCVVVILARFYGVTLSARKAPQSEPPVLSRPVKQVAAAGAPALTPQLSVEKPKRRVAAQVPELVLVAQKPAPPAVISEPSVADSSSAPTSAISAAITPSAAAERLFVSELPQGNFARPVVSDPDLVGEVELKALIGADGSVEEVSLVSGNPKLAQAGSRAVRRWHYSQEQGLGRQAEALIRMSFFGPDAVSVTSLAR